MSLTLYAAPLLLLPFFFHVAAAIKQLGAGQKFIDLADRGVIDQRLDKKRRKIVAKDKHYMPGQ
jgi:hypothetical protein